MNRRDSLKTLIIGTAGAGLATTLPGCRTDGTDSNAGNADPNKLSDAELSYLTPKELDKVQRLRDQTFFTEHELATITALAHVILPANEYGSVEDAKVPEFIEFRVKEEEAWQLPMRGGLAWLNREANTRFEKDFRDLTASQQIEIVDPLAGYDHKIAERDRTQPQQFFGLMRNLTAVGYYTSPVGIKDIGYQGNQPNVWDGVPDEVLAKHGVAYEPEWLAKCIDQDTRETVAAWDEKGNLIA